MDKVTVYIAATTGTLRIGQSELSKSLFPDQVDNGSVILQRPHS